MSSLLGGTIQPIQPPSLVGPDTQNAFLTALFGQGLQPNTQDGGMKFSGITPYGGPLSPDVNNTILPKVYGAYDPNTAGAPLYSQLQNMNPTLNTVQGMMPPMLNSVQQYGGMSGFPLQMMHNVAQFGTTGYTNYMNPFLSARPYSSRG